MGAWKTFLSHKLLWGGLAAVLAVLSIFGVAMLGSVLTAKPKQLPVALVVLDREADLPGGGGKLNVGATILDKLLANKQLPVTWTVLPSEEAAVSGMDEKSYYGALVLPADLSAGVVSLLAGNPQPGTVRIYANEGMNVQVATTVKQMLQQGMQGVNAELTKQLLAQLGQRSPQIPLQTAQALLAPMLVAEQTLHPVGAGSANGSAPNILTQLAWLGSLVVSAILFLVARQAERGSGRWAVVSTQTALGLLAACAAASFLLWMADAWYGMDVADWADVWPFLLLVAATFFLLQSALLNWLGIRAMIVLVLLMFFSMPVIGVAPEMLPQAAHDWLYSWVPFRFAAAGLRDALYFGGTDALRSLAGILGAIAAVSLVVLLASALRKRAASDAAAAAVRA